MEKILVIDDSTVAQALLAEIFSKTYELDFRNDGAAGLNAARQIQPDLILLDVNMPGLDGFEVCRILKREEETREIPVIFVTSVDSGDEKVKGFQAGADDYVVKPFCAQELQARVSAHLGARRAKIQALGLERLTVFREMAVAVSHEINNPLTSVFACLHLLQNELANGPETVTEYLASLHTEMKRIQDIVGKLATATKASKTRYSSGINMIDLHDI
jgi:DNA-binding response OmpR family regulator